MNTLPPKIRRTTTSTTSADAGRSPPKKPRFRSPEPLKPSTSTEEPRKTLHTHSQIWKWTFTPDAVAPCRVGDVFRLEECEGTKGKLDTEALAK